MSGAAFVGVDSGGTRTNVDIVVDGADTRRGSYEVGDSLSGALTPKLIPTVLRKVFAPLEMKLAELDADHLPVHIWVSAAGFSPWTRDDYVLAASDLMPTIAGDRAKNFGVANDAVSLLLGSHADGIVIAGTGSNVILRSTDGDLYQAGGHEWVACDYGSGFWIGLLAIRQAYRDHEAGLDSVLLQRLRQVYGLRPDDDRALIAKLRDLAIGDPNMKREIARFAASVCGAAERGDLGAQNIVKAEAEDLADVTAGSLRRRFSLDELSGGLRLVQCGSLLANSFYRASFEAQLEMRLRSGADHQAAIDWERVITGGTASVALAREIDAQGGDLLRLDMAFRPAIVKL